MNTQPRNQGPRTSERGFTLLETIVALFVFTMGILVATAMQVAGIHGLRRTENTTLATNIASNHLEELMLWSRDELIDIEQPPPLYYGRYGQGLARHERFSRYTLEWEWEAEDPTNDPYINVIVTTSWNKEGRQSPGPGEVFDPMKTNRIVLRGRILRK